jgi:hypothetical protein
MIGGRVRVMNLDRHRRHEMGFGRVERQKSLERQ